MKLIRKTVSKNFFIIFRNKAIPSNSFWASPNPASLCLFNFREKYVFYRNIFFLNGARDASGRIKTNIFTAINTCVFHFSPILIVLVSFFVSKTSFSSYNFTTPIIVNHGQVGGTETNFPVLVQTSNVIFSTAAAGHMLTAYDLVYSTWSDCHYLLNWDTETVNNTGSAQMNTWVNVPSLSNATDTVFYACYGNAAITTYQGISSATWNSNYAGVWHLPNGTTLTANDSTSNGNNGSLINGTSATSGQIDGAASMNNGSVQYISVGASTSLAPAAITVSAWVNGNSFPDAYNAVVSRINTGTFNYWQYFIKSNGTLAIYLYTPTTPQDYDGTGTHTLSTNTWYQVAFTYDSVNGIQGYVNGSLDGSAAQVGALDTTQSITAAIGQDTLTAGRSWNGSIDEVHISNTARTSDWMLTEFNSQNSPSTFLVFDTEVNNALLPENQKGLLIQGGRLTIRGGRVNIQ